ncbi:MAG: YdcF family protein [Hyphomonadaceae bacterium]|nr:YdcF family protein [Clostridia bacterium]
MLKKINWKHTIIGILLVAFLCLFVALAVDFYVSQSGKKNLTTLQQAPQADAIIVFGALVFSNGQPSDMLQDRLDVGLKLYQANKATRIVVTGDHGQKSYDEVNGMRQYLQAKGVPREAIFMDHAGFNTYDSLYRAKDIFEIKKAILVTQEYHLVRALYIGKQLGLSVVGVPSDTHVYPGMPFYLVREVGSRFKAFLQAGVFHPEPKYLGDTIPIWKSGVLTDDGK